MQDGQSNKSTCKAIPEGDKDMEFFDKHIKTLKRMQVFINRMDSFRKTKKNRFLLIRDELHDVQYEINDLDVNNNFIKIYFKDQECRVGDTFQEKVTEAKKKLGRKVVASKGTQTEK